MVRQAVVTRYDDVQGSPFAHDALQCLDIELSSAGGSCDDFVEMLQTLILPSLQQLSLVLTNDDSIFDIFLLHPIVAQSHFSLQLLSLADGWLSESDIIRALELLPSLQCIRLSNIRWSIPTQSMTSGLFERLVDKKRSIVPVLTELELHRMSVSFSPEQITCFLKNFWGPEGMRRCLRRFPLWGWGDTWVLEESHVKEFAKWEEAGYDVPVNEGG